MSVERSDDDQRRGLGLRYPGLVMRTGDGNEVKEFTGTWRLKPDADLVAFTKALLQVAGSTRPVNPSRI